MKYEWKAEKRRVRMQQVFVILLVILCFLGTKYLKTIPGNTLDNWQRQTKKGRNDKSFHELVADLAYLGLTEVTDEQLSTAEKSWDSIPEEFREYTEKLPMLLSMIGRGNYDYDTWEQNPKRLYYMSDGMQECIVFYCTPDWAKEFKNVTGYELESKVH